MSSPSDPRGAFVCEDYGAMFGRTYQWPSIPKHISPLYATGESTDVVCSVCHRATGGLRFDAATETFVHSDERNCTLSRFSQR